MHSYSRIVYYCMNYPNTTTWRETNNKKNKNPKYSQFFYTKILFVYISLSLQKKGQNITAGCLLPLDLAGAVLVLDLLALGHARVPVRFAVGAADWSVMLWANAKFWFRGRLADTFFAL